MTPTHHCPEDWLLGHATGELTEAEHLLVAVHTTLCPTCREAVWLHETLLGRALSETEELPLHAGALEAVLEGVALPGPDSLPATYDPMLPSPLADYVGLFSEIRFEPVLPGIRIAEVGIDAGMPVRLFELAPGMHIPAHTHQGLECTLVLAGAFTDEDGRFGRGDLAIRDHTRDHEQQVHEGEPCIALVVADAPLVPRSEEASAIASLVRL